MIDDCGIPKNAVILLNARSLAIPQLKRPSTREFHGRIEGSFGPFALLGTKSRILAFPKFLQFCDHKIMVKSVRIFLFQK